MNGDVEGVASRPRPLSGGLWTLFSWLRRDDHASSNESLSSVGSDRTAASFAFLAPAYYSVNNNPVLLPPPSPPTDSYRKRVQERNARRQHDKDLTLHRKYGLYRSDISNGYDAFSLPSVRRAEEDISSKWERERRATSECFQRRALHVPGKRRAPLPPVRTTIGSSVTYYKGPRKRRAPQPPIKIIEENKEKVLETNKNSILMNPQIVSNDKNSTTNTSEKCNKKENSTKDTKTRLEKGFFKHIFENRKRNSTIDTSAVKILPSISELDKQAATIIENGKREALKQITKTDQQHQQALEELGNSNKKSKADSWFCVKCLRKYDSSVSNCPYCIFDQKQTTIEILKSNVPNAATNASSTCTQTESRVISQTPGRYKSEEKQKLKEMLKEMKDSLPKRPKHDNKERILNKNSTDGPVTTVVEKNSVSETPTLRIGSSVAYDDTASVSTKPSTSALAGNMIISNNTTPLESFSSVITSRPIVMHHEAKKNNSLIPNTSNLKLKDSIPQLLKVNNLSKTSHANESNIIKKSLENRQKMEDKLVGVSLPNKTLQTPLRISSLLNPVYVPKRTDSKSFPTENVLHTELTSSQTRVDKVLDNSKETPAHIVNSSCGITNTPIKTHCDNANVNETKNNENIKLSDITVVKKSPPVLPNQSITNVKNTNNTTNNLAHVNINSDARPSTSTDMPINNSKLKTVELDCINQHIKRRELINQLEKSIANGDEHAAAEAAVKLAQLRLSCSVLSFSSQIMSEPTKPTPVEKNNSSGLVTNEPSEKAQNKSKIINADVTESRLPFNSIPIVAPIASSKEKYLQRNEIRINLPQNDKYVSSSDKIASEKIDLIVSKNREVFKNLFTTTEASTCKEKANAVVSISVWVEDKEATRGPIKLNTNRQAIVGDLRKQAEAALGLPSHLQRWIVGRNLCTDDNTPLVTLAGSEFNAPFYLCLVETDPHVASTSRQAKEKAADNANKNTDNVYKELVQLEQQALVYNTEDFECGVCIEECKPGSGVILRECVHMFCRECLADVVRHSEEPDISCPAMGCSGLLQEREIRGLVSPEEYERWLARGLAAAESGTRNAFHCRTPDCTGWALCDPGVRRFLCPVCKHSNCVPCQAIHEGETCEQHRAKLQAVSNIKSSNQSDDSTRALLNNLINKGEALECPECKAIITKMWGCDWVKCSACKTEICWVTRGRRWGPAGRGDTSAGCRCGVDGKRCHPSCGYCH